MSGYAHANPTYEVLLPVNLRNISYSFKGGCAILSNTHQKPVDLPAYSLHETRLAMRLTPEEKMNRADLKPPLIIWRLIDGKPGHEKQTLGLANALLKNRQGQCFTLAVPRRSSAFLHWLLGHFPQGIHLPKPDILLAAGHATHFALLAARRAYGGMAVLLMKPSLPISLFDVCVIPEHDHPPVRHNVIRILGVLNDVRATATQRLEQGLMLMGGVSSHYRWDDSTVGAAVVAIAQASPNINWQLTTSRRTPASFQASLAQPLPGNLELIPHETTGAGWLEQRLTQARQVWVTQDSVSMVYEALTAGAGVGLLTLPELRNTRVSRGVQKLITEAWVTPYDRWRTGETLARPPTEFNEANRVAHLILMKHENDAAP